MIEYDKRPDSAKDFHIQIWNPEIYLTPISIKDILLDDTDIFNLLLNLISWYK